MKSGSPIDIESHAAVVDPSCSETALFGLAGDNADDSRTDGPSVGESHNAPDLDDDVAVEPVDIADDLLLDDDDGLLRLSPVDEGDAPRADAGPIWFGGEAEADAEDLRIDPRSNDTCTTRIPDRTRDRSDGDTVGAIDDHSAAQDVILAASCADTVELRPSRERSRTVDDRPPLPKPGEIAGIAAGLRTKTTPKRIGSGRLVPSRLTWKPKDPFADLKPKTRRFRWEIMLTTACGTAVCGMGAIWLLRAVVS